MADGAKMAGAASPGAAMGAMATCSLFCGLWRTDGGFVSTIHIKNSLITAPLMVTPSLFTPDGSQLTLPAVILPAGGEADVNINRALNAILPPGAAPAHGSAELSYTWSSPGHVVASMQMLDAGRSLIFTDAFQPPQVVQPVGVGAPIPDPGPAPHRIEMLWWRHDPGVHGLLSLANTSGQDLDVSYQITGSSGAPLPAKSVALGPHQSQLLDLSGQIAQIRGYLASSGGITINYRGIMGQLLVAGLLENNAEGYSDHMPYGFHDRGGAAASYRYAAPGLLVGMPDPALGFRPSLRFQPYLVLRNAGAAPLDVHVTLCWQPEGSQDGTASAPADSSDRYALPPLRFAPGGSAQVDMQGILSAAGLAGFDGSVNVMVSFTGHEGDLIVAAGSVDLSGSFVFAVLPEPVQRSFGKRESYWATGGGYDTMITLWNTGATAEDILVRLRYADGSGRYTLPVHLAPMASETIDLWQLIASGRADHKGRQFQMTEQSGSMSFESADSHTTWLHLNAEVAVYNPANGTCGCYCDPCCTYDNFGLSPATLLLDVNGKLSIQPFGCYCNGQQDVLIATITVTNTQVTVYSGGELVGVGPGETTINVEFDPITLGGVNCYGAYDTSSCYSAPVTLSPPPPATVTPSVSVACSAATLVMGTGTGAFDTSGTCTASVDPSGGSYAWSANKGTVGLSGSGATITYSAAAESSAVGDTTITLDYTTAGESASVPVSGITVRDPTSLLVLSDTGTEQTFNCSAAGLGDYSCGAQRQIVYQVADGLGAVEVGGIPVQEAFTAGVDGCAGVPATPRATSGVTQANGEFPTADTLALCSSSCSTGACPPPGSCQETVGQTWYANGLAVRNNAVAYGCAKITVNGQ